MITLAPYGFYWFELQERDKSAPVVPRAVPEFETLVVPLNATWVSLARERGVFERDVLPAHLARTRWYPERSAKAIQPTLISAVPFCDIGDNRPWLAFFETTQRGVTTRYVLPMQIEWVRFDRERYNPHALAAVRQGAREGTLLDVATDQIFIALLLRNLRESLVVEDGEQGLRLEFKPTSRFSDKAGAGSRSASVRSRPSNPTARRWSTKTMSSRSTESWKTASTPRSRWAASSPTSWASPTRRPCSAAWSWSMATSEAPSVSSTASSPTRATPGS